MIGEKLTLSQNEATQASVQNVFRNLWTDHEFADVTIATVDDHQVRAHKVILASCSALFRNILSKNPHQSPLIYLKDIPYTQLDLIMKFVYLGQCEVSHEDVGRFLDIGKELQIQGLVDDVKLSRQTKVESATPVPFPNAQQTFTPGPPYQNTGTPYNSAPPYTYPQYQHNQNIPL